MGRKPAPPGADRRQMILEAALDVFAERGFEGATTKEIAARASVTHGLIYFYFASKEELFQAAFEHTLRGALDTLNIPRAAPPEDDPAEVIERAILHLLTTFSSPRASSLMRIMTSMAAHGDRLAGPLRECKVSMMSAMGEIAGALTAYLDEQVARGRLRPANTRVAVNLLLSGVMSAFRPGAHSPLIDAPDRAQSLQEWAHAMADILMLGLAPRSESLNDAPAVASRRSHRSHRTTSRATSRTG